MPLAVRKGVLSSSPPHNNGHEDVDENDDIHNRNDYEKLLLWGKTLADRCEKDVQHQVVFTEGLIAFGGDESVKVLAEAVELHAK